MTNLSDIAQAARDKAPVNDVAKLIESFAAAEVKRQLTASPRFLDTYLSNVDRQVARLALATEGVLVRGFRENLNALVATVRAMGRSCRENPSNVDLELALPAIIGDIADAVDNYAESISDPKRASTERQGLQTIEGEIADVRLPWARRLLDKMSTQGSGDAANSLTLSTAFFKNQ